MPSLTILFLVIPIAIIINQIKAQNFVEDALKNLQRHQVAQSKQLKDKYYEPRYDEDNYNNVNSISIQDLSALLEQVLNTNADYDVKKRIYGSKQQKYETYLDKLNDKNLDDVLVYYPESKKPMRTEEWQRNTLGSLVPKPNYHGLKGIDKTADRKEYQKVNKKRNYQKSLLDELNELEKDKVVLFDPDSDTPIRTERKQKNPSMDAVDSDDLNDEALVYVVQLNADAIRNPNQFKQSLKDLMPLASQKYRSDQKKEQRYKGFRVKNVRRRMRSDSREKYASEEMVESRPVKRPRFAGGFGGVARTPIPYIRHRGDIYEKYN